MLWLQPPAVYCQPRLTWTFPPARSPHAGLGALACVFHLSSMEAHRCSPQLSLVHACRFVCRQKLGLHAGAGAEYVAPLPENAVVYGSGDKAIVLTRVGIASFAARLPKLHPSPGCCRASNCAVQLLLLRALAHCMVAESTMLQLDIQRDFPRLRCPWFDEPTPHHRSPNPHLPRDPQRPGLLHAANPPLCCLCSVQPLCELITWPEADT